MSEKRKPRNTSNEAKENPLSVLAMALGKGTSKMIEDQEASGQRDFVSSTTLPTEFMSDNGKTALEKAGVVFGDVVEGDPLFQYVVLPEGWKKRTTDHSVHSVLVDDKGRNRASIFYKAAFYDRKASISLRRRYTYTQGYERLGKESVYVALVKDGDIVIHQTEPIPKPADKEWLARESSDKLAIDWLDQHYPDWKDASAYWND